MSDLYHPSLPYAQDRQRERTARDTMPGIDTDAGFVCGMCHSPRRVS